MATDILSQLADDLNEHINAHAELETKLLQAESMARVGEGADFDQFSKATLRHYMLNLLELIENATQLNDHISKELHRLASEIKKHSE